MIKIAVVVIAGVGVFLHQRSTSRRGLAVWGSVGAPGLGGGAVPGSLPGRLSRIGTIN